MANEYESIIACPTYLPSPPLSHKFITPQNLLPSPPPSYQPITRAPMSLRLYIEKVMIKSRMDTGTLLLSLSYAHRLRSKLYGTSKGMECTHHRIFLATLIIAYKYVHDAAIKNKHWVSYSLNLFSNNEVNLMEKQLLQLLDYNLEIHPHEIDRIMKDISHIDSYPTPPYEDRINYFVQQEESNVVSSFKPSPPLLHLNKFT